MAIKTYITERNETITIDDTHRLGRPGGEGAVFHIQSPSKYSQDYCAKIYLPHILNDVVAIKLRYQKIQYMINHPITLQRQSQSVRICAPVALLFEKGKRQFVGFIMLKAFPESEQLTWLSASGYDLTCKKVYPKFEVFSAERNLEAVYNRLILANNIAYAIYSLHHTKHYVLVDTKPENILITSTGDVSLIDIDSVQIVDSSGKLIFKSTVWSEQYKPPEGYDGRIKLGDNTIIQPSWDAFSFGVIAYELLIGSHPYVGSYKAPYNKGTDIMYNISQGLFLHGSKQAYLNNTQALKMIFDRWNAFPKALRDIFYQTFELGQSQPHKRPSMLDWGKVLTNTIQGLKKSIPQNVQVNRNKKTSYNPKTMSHHTNTPTSQAQININNQNAQNNQSSPNSQQFNRSPKDIAQGREARLLTVYLLGLIILIVYVNFF